MFQTSKQKKISSIVFGVYVVLLTWLILFKFSTNLSGIPNIRNINLIPFYYGKETNTHIKEIFYNIIVFVPLGVYIQIFRKDRAILSKVLSVFGTSFLFELTQFVFAIGASDITDILGNTFGGFVGLLIGVAMKKIAPEKYISIINVVGMLIEIVAVLLMMLLLRKN